MNEKLETIRRISNRLLIALGTLAVLFICGATYSFLSDQSDSKEAELKKNGSVLISPPMMAMTVGCIGGFVGLQRRIKKMSDEDLTLLANSWVYICLSPLVGGILAVLIYVLFVSELLAGHIFPSFQPDASAVNIKSLRVIFYIHGDAQDYAKLIFWCFLAGFSERFVTDIISRFESQTSDNQKPADS